jgi:hypothetical protein
MVVSNPSGGKKARWHVGSCSTERWRVTYYPGGDQSALEVRISKHFFNKHVKEKKKEQEQQQQQQRPSDNNGVDDNGVEEGKKLKEEGEKEKDALLSYLQGCINVPISVAAVTKIVADEDSERARASKEAKTARIVKCRALCPHNAYEIKISESSASFEERGYAEVASLRAETAAVLLELHVELFKVNGSGGQRGSLVHTSGGARIILVCDRDLDLPALETGETSVLINLQHRFRGDKAKYKRFSDALLTLRRHIATEAARDVALLPPTAAFMLFANGQEPQCYHQDCPHAVVSAIAYLTESDSTQYANYDQKRWASMQPAARKAYFEGCWEKTTKEYDPRSLGLVSAGTVVLGDTSHIHRAPPPPETKTNSRRTIFLAFENKKLETDGGPIRSASEWFDRV